MVDFHQVGNDYYYSDEHEEMEEGDIQGEEWVKKGNRWVMGPNMAPMEGERGGEDELDEEELEEEVGKGGEEDELDEEELEEEVGKRGGEDELNEEELGEEVGKGGGASR